MPNRPLVSSLADHNPASRNLLATLQYSLSEKQMRREDKPGVM
jgi:hypothetical protein